MELFFQLLISTVAILEAGRNALSFFMLLVVSLGLSVVRESLGRTMLKCQILAGLHFVFGGKFGLCDICGVTIINIFISTLCRRHSRTRTRVDVSIGTPHVHHTASVYAQRVPYVDPVLVEQSVR